MQAWVGSASLWLASEQSMQTAYVWSWGYLISSEVRGFLSLIFSAWSCQRVMVM